MPKLGHSVSLFGECEMLARATADGELVVRGGLPRLRDDLRRRYGQSGGFVAKVDDRSLINHEMSRAMLAYLRILIFVFFAMVFAALSAHAQEKVEGKITKSECERVCGQATEAKFDDQDKKVLDACIRQKMCAPFASWWRGMILLCADCSTKPCINCM
jgi:hypothetical protein